MKKLLIICVLILTGYELFIPLTLSSNQVSSISKACEGVGMKIYEISYDKITCIIDYGKKNEAK